MTRPEKVGFKHPPVSTRFKKGQSGNPRGRPKSKYRDIPHDAVLGQMVTIREDGRQRRVTAAEAFLLQLTQRGLVGDGAAARPLLDTIEAARAKRGEGHNGPTKIVFNVIGSGPDAVAEPLGIARRKYPTDEARMRWQLNPWIVEAALKRMGDRRLTIEEQREVFANTRTPDKVNWPDWWEACE